MGGLFLAIKDTKIAYDLYKAASDINSYQQDMMQILNRYGNNSNISPMDRVQIRGYLQRIEDKVIYMTNRMKDLAPDHLFQTMVPCLDGHLTAVPGYVMATKELITCIRAEL